VGSKVQFSNFTWSLKEMLEKSNHGGKQDGFGKNWKMKHVKFVNWKLD